MAPESLKSVSSVGAPLSPEAWAARFEPVFLTEAKRYNIPLRVDFDGDWKATDNAFHYNALLRLDSQYIQDPYRKKESSLRPAVYFETLETSTHIYLTYYLFFPYDAGDYHTFEPGDPRGGHNNDSTSVMVVASKSSSDYFVVTADHEQVARLGKEEARTFENRPVVEISSGNHSLRILKKGEILKEEGKEDRRKIFLYRHGEPDQPYQLLRILDSIWPQRENSDLFTMSLFGFGAQFVGDHGPWAPWARSFSKESGTITEGAAIYLRTKAKSFFDPAPIFCKGQPENLCSLKYLQNPYE